jgi:hypothetical protein
MISIDLGKIYDKLYDNRQKGDYADLVKFEKEIVLSWLKEAENFVANEVAQHYFQQGRRVFFRENRVVHWGERNFLGLAIEGHEEPEDVFGFDVPEIRFEPKFDRKIMDAHVVAAVTAVAGS